MGRSHMPWNPPVKTILILGAKLGTVMALTQAESQFLVDFRVRLNSKACEILVPTGVCS